MRHRCAGSPQPRLGVCALGKYAEAVAAAGFGEKLSGDGQMRLAGAGPADQHGVALLSEEAPGGEVMDEGLIDGRAREGEVGEVLGQRQLGDGELVLAGRALYSMQFGNVPSSARRRWRSTRAIAAGSVGSTPCAASSVYFMNLGYAF